MELFRYNKRLKYSQDLCAGIVSFSSLSLYSDVENTERLGDARVDKEEGVINTFDGVVKSHKFFANDTKVFCCSTTKPHIYLNAWNVKGFKFIIAKKSTHNIKISCK